MSRVCCREVLRFLRREAGLIQAGVTFGNLHSNNSSHHGNTNTNGHIGGGGGTGSGGGGISESSQLQASELMSKIKQIWVRLDKPTSLPTVLASGTGLIEKPTRLSVGSNMNGSGSNSMTGGSSSSGSSSSSTNPSSNSTNPSNIGAGSHSSTAGGSSSSATIPNLNLSKLSLNPSGSNGSSSSSSSSSAVGASASSHLHATDLSSRNVLTQLTREELVHLFRDFTNDELDTILRTSLQRSKLLHPNLPSASVLHSRPSLTQTRLKDLFRWLFDALDTTSSLIPSPTTNGVASPSTPSSSYASSLSDGRITGLQIRDWLIGPSPDVGGRSKTNDMLKTKLPSHITSQIRIITNKLEDKRRYTKPEFEYFFLRWSYEDLLHISNEFHQTCHEEMLQFQETVRTFHSLTRRLENMVQATSRGQERLEERKRQLMALTQTTTMTSKTTTNGTTSASSSVPSSTNVTSSNSSVSSVTEHLSSDIVALLNEKERRIAEDSERERKEQYRTLEMKRKEEKENYEFEQRKRRIVLEAELKRSKERRQILERDWRRDQTVTEEGRQAYRTALSQLWTKSEGKFGSNELEYMFKLQETYSISRRIGVEILQQLSIPVERINAYTIATIPDLEPVCGNCLIHTSTHVSNTRAHIGITLTSTHPLSP